MDNDNVFYEVRVYEYVWQEWHQDPEDRLVEVVQFDSYDEAEQFMETLPHNRHSYKVDTRKVGSVTRG